MTYAMFLCSLQKKNRHLWHSKVCSLQKTEQLSELSAKTYRQLVGTHAVYHAIIKPGSILEDWKIVLWHNNMKRESLMNQIDPSCIPTSHPIDVWWCLIFVPLALFWSLFVKVCHKIRVTLIQNSLTICIAILGTPNKNPRPALHPSAEHHFSTDWLEQLLGNPLKLRKLESWIFPANNMNMLGKQRNLISFWSLILW